METKRVTIGELEGAALDWAVAAATWSGEMDSLFNKLFWEVGFKPSSDWSQCGPLIERHGVSLMHRMPMPGRHGGYFHAQVGPEEPENDSLSTHHSPLIAACRAIVASHNPDGYVEVPVELLGGE